LDRPALTTMQTVERVLAFVFEQRDPDHCRGCAE